MVGQVLANSPLGGGDETPGKGKDESVKPIKEGMVRGHSVCARAAHKPHPLTAGRGAGLAPGSQRCPHVPAQAFWKHWMTLEDKPTYGREEPLCRNSMLPWHAQWHCLWDTAWWGPHGFLFGNGDETKKDAVDFKQCHCYFKWFFERDPFIPTPKDKRNRERVDRQDPPDMKRMVIGKNMFVHLFFGILLGWLYAIIKVQLYGGDAPWIQYFQDKAKRSATAMVSSASSMLLAPAEQPAQPGGAGATPGAPPSQPAAPPGSRVEALMNTPR